MRAGRGPESAGDAVLTLPNLVSLGRVLLIPPVVWLILRKGTEAAGLLAFAAVAATDWVDGAIARRTGQVSELGKVLDPAADRLVIAAGLLAVVLRDAFPLWAALLVLVRDAGLLVAGAILLVGLRTRIEVRWVGKMATLTLMVAIPLVAWGNLGLPLAGAALAVGWAGFAAGLGEAYWAAALYGWDLRRALTAGASRTRQPERVGP